MIKEMQKSECGIQNKEEKVASCFPFFVLHSDFCIYDDTARQIAHICIDNPKILAKFTRQVSDNPFRRMDSPRRTP